MLKILGMCDFTKGEIDRIGKDIRNEGLELSDGVLVALQEYRTSHQLPLANVFRLICKIAKRIHNSSIATYRIKRFESIINKLDRYPEMRFSRMWDIAGCRIILKDENEVYRTVQQIKATSELEVIKVKDYIEQPQDDGYKAVHLYLRHFLSTVVVEVQLRTLKNHNWATLVEITDLLYKTRLKEIGNDSELLEFHKLLSDVDEIDVNGKHKIVKILKERNYFESLSEVFSRNYLIVRRQWLKFETKTNHKYFLIEVENNTPSIKSFRTFSEAEREYFELYKNKSNINAVLTYLQNPNYELLATAYANYILTFHSFLYECLDVIEVVMIDCLLSKKYLLFKRVYDLYHDLIYIFNKNIIMEIDDSHEVQFQPLTQKERDIYNRKRKAWLADIKTQIQKTTTHQRRVQDRVRKALKEPGFNNFIFKYTIRFSNFDYKKRNRRLFERSKVLGPLVKRAITK